MHPRNTLLVLATLLPFAFANDTTPSVNLNTVPAIPGPTEPAIEPPPRGVKCPDGLIPIELPSDGPIKPKWTCYTPVHPYPDPKPEPEPDVLQPVDLSDPPATPPPKKGMCYNPIHPHGGGPRPPRGGWCGTVVPQNPIHIVQLDNPLSIAVLKHLQNVEIPNYLQLVQREFHTHFATPADITALHARLVRITAVTLGTTDDPATSMAELSDISGLFVLTYHGENYGSIKFSATNTPFEIKLEGYSPPKVGDGVPDVIDLDEVKVGFEQAVDKLRAAGKEDFDGVELVPGRGYMFWRNFKSRNGIIRNPMGDVNAIDENEDVQLYGGIRAPSFD